MERPENIILVIFIIILIVIIFIFILRILWRDEKIAVRSGSQTTAQIIWSKHRAKKKNKSQMDPASMVRHYGPEYKKKWPSNHSLSHDRGSEVSERAWAVGVNERMDERVTQCCGRLGRGRGGNESGRGSKVRLQTKSKSNQPTNRPTDRSTNSKF